MSGRRRRWSQHWLANDELATSLVRLLAPQQGERFLEIGAGQGRLTRALLDRSVAVTAVEIDPHCCAMLAELAPGKELQVIAGDVLELDPAALCHRPPLRVVGNLPYAIASPILRWTLQHRDIFADVHYMLPTDVAKRVLAPPGSHSRGLLSVNVQWHYRGDLLVHLGPGSFRPPPKVDSAFVRLRPRTPPRCNARHSHRLAVTEAAFSHRRKTLANALRHAGWDRPVISNACDTAGIDAGERAETLTLEDFARLAEALPELSS
ncbi:MAG: 16S rRNA (adenine(1518)-N(6)/adenine(1519)-N(6))-dimethyltransferase RsmA [Acidobacteriota bacterium]